ncbi:MAG: hypothetical protein AAGK30_15525 [Pseudomonadota bacterium]
MRLAVLLLACAPPIQAAAFELVPCYHVGGNQVVPIHANPHWKQDVRSASVGDAGVVWYSGNPPVPENDLTVIVLEDCAADTDLVMYTPQHTPEKPFLDLVMDVFDANPAANREAVVDAISMDSNATWTRDAMTGSCVCDAHSDDTEVRK